ncbi:hypothetical protein CK203_091258 [Vitis vinifera]|uniref:Uncharacterized protein n=1 Tax=Vitis vinifera TaxID=29760 RepID=A0A438DRM9_VITVI|nr:hypothetical protein CK203_091258 [Vitis vinifera]
MRDPQYSHDSYKRSGEPRAYSTNMQVSEVPYPSPCSERTSVSKNYYYEDSSSSSWGFSDPEIKRRKRIALYKAYGVEGKMKASLRVRKLRKMRGKKNLPSHCKMLLVELLVRAVDGGSCRWWEPQTARRDGGSRREDKIIVRGNLQNSHMEALQYFRMMEVRSEYDIEAMQKADDFPSKKEKEM